MVMLRAGVRRKPVATGKRERRLGTCHAKGTAPEPPAWPRAPPLGLTRGSNVPATHSPNRLFPSVTGPSCAAWKLGIKWKRRDNSMYKCLSVTLDRVRRSANTARDARDPPSSTTSSWLKGERHPWVLTTNSPAGYPNPVPLLWMLQTRPGHPLTCSNLPTTPDTGNAKAERAAGPAHGAIEQALRQAGCKQGCDKANADDGHQRTLPLLLELHCQTGAVAMRWEKLPGNEADGAVGDASLGRIGTALAGGFPWRDRGAAEALQAVPRLATGQPLLHPRDGGSPGGNNSRSGLGKGFWMV